MIYDPLGAQSNALYVGNLRRGSGLDLAESLVRVDSMFGENVAVELVGLLHLPEEWTGGGEESVDRLEGSVSGFGID
jgi:hypothetical protein